MTGVTAIWRGRILVLCKTIWPVARLCWWWQDGSEGLFGEETLIHLGHST